MRFIMEYDQRSVQKALKMLSDGYSKSDVCTYLQCTAGVLDRALKATPELLRKARYGSTVKLGQYDEATSGIILRAMTSGDDDRISKVCRALGKSKQELMGFILGA